MHVMTVKMRRRKVGRTETMLQKNVMLLAAVAAERLHSQGHCLATPTKMQRHQVCFDELMTLMMLKTVKRTKRRTRRKMMIRIIDRK